MKPKTETKFTKGDWQNTIGHLVFASNNGVKRIVADCQQGHPFDEESANAQLIAASPSLYAALELAQQFFLTYGPYDGSTLELSRTIDAALNRAVGKEEV